jgi:hypothetical protein
VPADPITIELANRIDRVAVNEPVPLHLVIRCPVDGSPAELRSIVSRDTKTAELDTDLFERDLTLRPGEVYRCTVVARFHAIGAYPEPLFQVQVGRDGNTTRPRIPTPTIRVVPSLLGELRVRAESICTYDHGTKVDVTVTHAGQTKFSDFQLTLGPAAGVRAGVSDHRRPAFVGGEELKFTTVIVASEMELTLDAHAGREGVGPVALRLPVPPVRDAATTTPFRFLEPKKLTQAEVKVRTLDEAGDPVRPRSGVYEVYGGGTKYRVEIKPAHPHASAVRLRSVSGMVEVTDMPADPGTWAFQMVVVSNGVFTTPVALHYDVLTPDGPQQGELNLAVRPCGAKHWLVAVTAGAAITVKGAAAVVPAVLSPGDLWNSLGSAMVKVDTLWDLTQFLSIPVIRAGLWVLDRIARPFQEG